MAAVAPAPAGGSPARVSATQVDSERTRLGICASARAVRAGRARRTTCTPSGSGGTPIAAADFLILLRPTAERGHQFQSPNPCPFPAGSRQAQFALDYFDLEFGFGSRRITATAADATTAAAYHNFER